MSCRTIPSWLACWVAAMILLGGCGETIGTPTAPPTQQKAGTVRAAAMVDTTHGWALTAKGLFSTADGGLSWRNITPAAVVVGQIEQVTFLSGRAGWLIAGRGGRAAVYRTGNSGTSWRRAAVGPRDGELVGAAFLAFADASSGWALRSRQSSSAFSMGDLFRTSDGGASWTPLRAPIAGPMSFADRAHGVLVDPRGAGLPLWVTADGGASWNQVPIPSLDGFSTEDSTATAPLWTAGEGTLLITYGKDARTDVGLYRSSDGGLTWKLAADVPIQGPAGQIVPVAVAGSDTWIVPENGDQAFAVVTDEGAAVNTVSTKGLPADGSLRQLSFAGTQDGWAIAGTDGCTGFKTGCYERSALFATADGGRTWRQLTVG